MSGMFLFPVQLMIKCGISLVGITKNNMKVLSQTRRFETKTTVEDNKILYIVTTKGELFPDNKQSKAVTFDFKRLDGKRLTEKENKIGDQIFNDIIKDKP
jgi:hypothetical protein